MRNTGGADPGSQLSHRSVFKNALDAGISFGVKMISESNFEESLKAFRQARAVEAVASLHRRSVDQGTDKITMDEIDAEIKIVRKKLDRVR